MLMSELVAWLQTRAAAATPCTELEYRQYNTVTKALLLCRRHMQHVPIELDKRLQHALIACAERAETSLNAYIWSAVRKNIRKIVDNNHIGLSSL